MSSVRRTRAAYLVFFVLLALPAIPCRQAAWHGNSLIHTLLEAISTTLGLMAAAIALMRYYTKKTPAYLLLGSGLAAASVLEGYHAVITSPFPLGRVISPPTDLAAWSGIMPPVFLSLLLFLSSLTPKDWTTHWFFGRVRERIVYTIMGIATAASFLIFSLLPLPPVVHPGAFFCQPWDLVPATLFALTAVQHLRLGTWTTDAFERWLVFSLIAAMAGQLLYMSFSGHLYDAPYIVAHLLKLLSWILLTVGLLRSVFCVFRSEADATVQLRRSNSWLTEEIRHRVHAEQEVCRSRDELETRVRERTADLAQRNRQLTAAHAEMDLVLTSIPSILIGLDHPGHITRWNARASETFGIPEGKAIGRTLDNCGISWRSPDMRAEVSRWLRSPTLLRTEDIPYEKGGEERLVGFTVLPLLPAEDAGPGLLIIGADITGRRNAEEALTYLAAIVESVDAAIIGVDLNGKIRTFNAAAQRIYGYSLEEMQSRPISVLWPAELHPGLSAVRQRLQQGEVIEHVESVRVRKDGEQIPVLISYSPIRNGSGKVVSNCSVAVDITERKALERQLAQAQKLESIGQLAAGIAHEINTPIQYVGDNIRFLRDSFTRLEQLMEGYDRLVASARSTMPEASFLAEMEALAKAVHAQYLRTEIPKAIEDSLDGAGRVAEVVRAMKEFSHPGSSEKAPLDLNRAIESTALVSRNEWKYVAELKMDLAPDLPPVFCEPGEVNQVILNLIVNAAHAVADIVSGKPGEKGLITVTTRHDGGWVEMRVRDTGTGIPDDVQSHIFNPFFTTKPVGKGTGQGLAIAHAVIVKKHGGTISFDTAAGVGTTFLVRLPVGGPAGETAGRRDGLEHELASPEPLTGAQLLEPGK